MPAILRAPAVDSIGGFTKSSRYRAIKRGLLPPGVRLGTRSVGWPADEILAVNAAKIRGDSDDQIREIVAALIEARALTR